MRIGFIGAGNMATALLKGLERNERFFQEYPDTVCAVSDIDKERLRCLAGQFSGLKTYTDNQQLVDFADVLFLAVKPQVMVPVGQALATAKIIKPVISMAAGLSIPFLQKLFPQARLARMMPNTPCALGEGVIAMAYSPQITTADQRLLKLLLATSGVFIEIEESLMNLITALSGSGPAFVYTMAEALLKVGVAGGLAAEEARLVVSQTIVGAAKMLLSQPDRPVADFIAEVRSPGGTTAAGLQALAAGHWPDVLEEALRQATQRAQELEN